MYVINARNVNDALNQGIQLMVHLGKKTPSRAGMTLEVDTPVSTVYELPWERVLFGNDRDANPFFHLMESLWIINGRDDVAFLTEFNSRMGDYSDNGTTFNAPYGHRIRNAVRPDLIHFDQLDEVIKTLTQDPMSRQAVLQIWDEHDLVRTTKDKACNMSVVFRIREGKLCITVYNRSNDMIWGAYGANVVQFSMLQEYVAAKLNVPMGSYTQVSNSFHVYTEGPAGVLWDKLSDTPHSSSYIRDVYSNGIDLNLVTMRHDDMANFDYDLRRFFASYDAYGIEELSELRGWNSAYFNELVMPMLCIHRIHKVHGPQIAANYVDTIKAADWSIACLQWLQKRVK